MTLEGLSLHRVGKWTLYALLALVILAAQLLPLQTLPRVWAGPDLLVALTFAWAVRRPDYVPVILVGAIMLLADLLLQRPPGLMAGLVVLATHRLASSAMTFRTAGFMAEWATACLAIAAIAVANRLILAMMLVEQAPLALTVSRAACTMLVYPLVVAASHGLLRVRKVNPAQYTGFGERL